jgi:hypothetical protein
MVRYGKRVEDNGREESWAEDDDFTHAGDAYTVRITALYPYKQYSQGGDELLCHIDFLNVTAGVSGRFANVWCDARNPDEASGHLRRHSCYRTLRRLLETAEFIPSPIFPTGN